MTSLLPDFNKFADSVVLGLVCILSSPESRFCSSSTGCHFSRYAPKRFPPTDPFRLFDPRGNAWGVTCVRTLSLSLVTLNWKYIGNVLDFDVRTLWKLFIQQAFLVQRDVRECVKRRARSSAHRRGDRFEWNPWGITHWSANCWGKTIFFKFKTSWDSIPWMKFLVGRVNSLNTPRNKCSAAPNSEKRSV